MIGVALLPLTPARAATWEVVASGLDNPRGLAFSPDGALYVAEAGRGGTGPCIPSPEGGDACIGASGAVTRIDKTGQTRIATGLPSLANPEGGFAIGPVDISLYACKKAGNAGAHEEVHNSNLPHSAVLAGTQRLGVANLATWSNRKLLCLRNSKSIPRSNRK